MPVLILLWICLLVAVPWALRGAARDGVTRRYHRVLIFGYLTALTTVATILSVV